MKNQELARVDRAEAFWLPEASAPSLGKLVVFVHGTKPSPCHRVDLAPLKTEAPMFAATWAQEGDFCPARTAPYSYSEAFATHPRTDEVVILSAGADGSPEERKIPVTAVEPHSLRALRSPAFGAAERPFSFEGITNEDGPAPSAESLRALALQMSAGGAPGPGLAAPLGGAPLARSNGKYAGEAKWWNAVYSQCEIWIDTGAGRRYFRGKGGGFPGGGAFSGDLYTGDIGRLLQQTTTCQIVSTLFYVNITFWDAGSGNLGMFHGGGAGIGGGLLAGRWT